MRTRIRGGGWPARTYAAAAVFALTGRAIADPATWLLALDGNWSDPTNWDINPDFPNNNGTTYEVFIGVTGAPFIVTLDLGVTINELNLTSSDATLDLTSFTLESLGGWNQDAARVLGNGTGNILAFDTTLSGGAVLEGVAMYESGGTFAFSGGPGLIAEICDTCIDHNGSTVQWLGNGDVAFNDGSMFTNGAGSTFTISGSGNFAWDTLGAQPAFVNDGTILKDTDAGVTFFDGMSFANTGTLRTETGTLRTNGVVLAGNTLDQGQWEVVGGSQIDLVGVAIDTIDTRVLLDGVGSDIFDSNAAQSALANLATLGGNGRLEIMAGRDFTTGGSFTLDPGAALAIGDSTTFAIGSGTLTNLSGGVLSDGAYEIAGTLSVTEDVTDIRADVRLDGDPSDIFNQNTLTTALEGLTDIGATGTLTLAGGRDFTTATGIEFNVDASGALSLEADSEFFIPDGSTLGNLAGGSFNLGSFDVQDGATLRIFGGAAQVVNAGISLTGANSRIVDENDNDIFAQLDLIDSDGDLRLLDGRDVTTIGDLDVLGDATIGSVSQGQSGSILTVNGDLNQSDGLITLDGGTVTVTGTYTLGGILAGNGTINGNTVANGMIGAGQSPGEMTFMDDLTLEDDAGELTRLVFELGGTVPGVSHDRIVVDGTLKFLGQGDLAGVLQLVVLDGFVLADGMEFQLIAHGGREGGFLEYEGLDPPGPINLAIEYRSDGVYAVAYLVPAPASVLALAPALLLRRRRA
ncbi:MAG: hypothetical protein H6811_03070 [Phycisphaeraceae bacterium]|nr:hypothetical protein [Phycisphaeraceae bacterium]